MEAHGWLSMGLPWGLGVWGFGFRAYTIILEISSNCYWVGTVSNLNLKTKDNQGMGPSIGRSLGPYVP